MSHYSRVLIIFNPMSTGGQAKQKATRMAERLRKRGLTVTTQGTEYPGHAEVLAYQASQKFKQILIISASGDGGYNEVVNGIMRAKAENPALKPICSILPSGNANDHRRSVRKRPLTWAITHSEPEPMDLLKLDITKQGNQTTRYAHSYVGVGITSHAANILNKEKLGPIRELTLVSRAVFTYHPVAITEAGGRTKRYDSLIFANIPHMAKILRTGNKSDINNGSFRVLALPHRSQFWLFRILLNLLLLVFGLQDLPQQSTYSFGVPQNELIQLDGEVMRLAGGAHVTVTVARKAITVIR